MTKSRKPTIVDVAQEAGVSIATVSNVLNKRNVPLTEDTIQRVEQAVQLLGYRRNAMAAHLSSRKSRELGLIIPSFGGYYSRFAEVLEQKFHQFGYHLSVFSANGMNPEFEKRHLESLLQRRVDGLVCHGLAMSYESTRQIVGEGTPLVLFNGWGWPSDIASLAVNLDYAEASCNAVKYLLERGCQSFFYAESRRSLGTNVQRELGFNEGIQRYASSRVHGIMDTSEIGIEAFVDQALELAGSNKPIGILAFNDALALKLLSECQRRGMHVPEQIKLIGIDNEPYSQSSYPLITTYGMPIERQTHIIAAWLLKQIGEEQDVSLLDESRGSAFSWESGGQIDLPLTLIEREST